jgi:hypothetical protein
MRRIEWTLGLLSGLLALAAVVFTATQHIVQVTPGTAVYSIGTRNATIIASLLGCGLVVVASLLVALAAWQDARRTAAGLARGSWRWLTAPGAALCVVGVYLLAANNLWVAVGGSAPVYGAETSAAALFFPSTLAAILCAVVAALPHAQRQAPALA